MTPESCGSRLRYVHSTFAIFTGYTAWAAFGEMSRNGLEICPLFVITDTQMRY